MGDFNHEPDDSKHLNRSNAAHIQNRLSNKNTSSINRSKNKSITNEADRNGNRIRNAEE